jgi:hypothetical protein
MNNLETIQYLAHAEARSFAPRRLDDDSPPPSVPHLVVRTASQGAALSTNAKYSVEMRGHVGHDNEGRAPFICDFMRTAVLPNVDPVVDVSGIYPMELHDSYSYLPEAADDKYTSCLTFSKPMAHRHTILFPDPYQIGGYGGMLSVVDPVDFERKQDVALFAGTTTGARDPLANERVVACRWALRHRPLCQFFITQVAQMTVQDLQRAMPRDELASILHPPVSHQDHFTCKYIVNIRGNTCCWSRVPMVLNSNSLMLNVRHADGTWYYPLLQDGEHFVGVPDISTLPSVVQHCNANPMLCRRIVANGQQFVRSYCSPTHAAYYARCLVEAMASNR